MKNDNDYFFKGMISALLIAVGIIIAGSILASSIKYVKNADRYVEVKGLAEKMVKADQATWQVTFSASSPDLKGIYSKIQDEQSILIDFINSQKFSMVNVTKQPLSVRDNYADSASNPQAQKPMLRYTANATVIVMSNDVDKMAQAVQNTSKLVESGVLINYSDVSYLFNGLNSIKAGMLNEALINAKVAADQFAKQSGSGLGGIKSASQGLFVITAPDGSSYNNGTIDKRVRVVTNVRFNLK
ncbi:MAG: SIMPL domain-containing protein [Neisseriaceae bacterium]